MERILIVGASGHGKVVADALEAGGRYRVVGFLDDGRPAGEQHAGLPILGAADAEGLETWSSRCDGMVVGVGDNRDRAKLVARIRGALAEPRFVPVVHPSAVVSKSAQIGVGSVVCAGAVIGPGAVLGEHALVNTLASLDHDSVLGELASLAPGAVVGGCVRVGAHSAIGLGARVIHGLVIGEHTVVGAGATVLESLPARVVAYGTPARTIRARQPEDPYL